MSDNAGRDACATEIADERAGKTGEEAESSGAATYEKNHRHPGGWR
jgi:hypothetical protein